MPDPADDELTRFLAAARLGDQAGFTGLYRCLAPRVAGYLRARGVDDVDGVVNEVFLGAFTGIGRFEGEAAEFRSWLFTIAWNKAADAHRAKGRRVRTTDIDAVGAEPGGGNSEDEAVASLARNDVVALLDRLSPEQRDVILLRIVADLSLDETAAIIGKPVGAVKSMQHRALATLRRNLSQPVSPRDARTMTELR